MPYRSPRGTADIIPPGAEQWHWLEERARSVMARYGFQEVRTPIFEEAGLFSESAGTATDIVNKEMYCFEDRSRRPLALRPEGTAGAVRALIQSKAYGEQPFPIRWYYMGPMFRYEKPQAGRYRQFHQIGVEAWGEQDPALDVDVMAMGFDCLRAWGIEDTTLLIHTVGDTETRARYRQQLVEYLRNYESELPMVDQERLSTSPLRVLDSKEGITQQLLLEAPKLIDCLTPIAEQHWNHVCAILNTLNLSYHIEPRLVRGLDYYTHTVFEWVTPSSHTQAGTLGGGGAI
ncbi:histidine--tRNA ligase [Pasteuria penetrans]|uniref:histidine--tRNA ligase n=1 Tax=Pasteuria penetrans TaxID=86005 RepID=UPI000FAB6DB7|nr:histidine--tRNA ligase [Pasteuria penetrans]